MLGLEAISPLLRAKNIALRAMGQITPAGVVARRKYEAELDYWRGELNNLNLWFNEKSTDWWGIDPPDDSQKVVRSNLWQTNAVLTMHKLRPTYYEELGLEADAFKGKRVLEVGCGPLVPIQQFSACERHGIDPLADLYMASGWPLFDYDVKVVNGYGEALPYPDCYFDGVISVNALDHVDDFDKTISEIERVTRPGGQICIEVEYHEPTVTEPLRLNDNTVRQAFNATRLEKIAERGKAELFAGIVNRFGLTSEGISRRFGTLTNTERFALWHGHKLPDLRPQ